MERMDSRMLGKTNRGLIEMTVVTPSFSRSLLIEAYSSGTDRALVRILSPAKERGQVLLRDGNLVWLYTPSIERTIKLAPSVLLQSWLKSEFTYDDMLKASSFSRDYTHRFLDRGAGLRDEEWRIECLPKPGCAVVWGKVVFSIRQDFLPLRQEFYDEPGRLVKTLAFGGFREFSGRLFPAEWTMTRAQDSGRFTRLVYRQLAFDIPLPAGAFSLRHLSASP